MLLFHENLSKEGQHGQMVKTMIRLKKKNNLELAESK